MGILRNVLGIPAKPARGSATPIKGGPLALVKAPFRMAQNIGSALYAFIPVAILWGMTFKPPDEQAWGIGDYLGVFIVSVGIANVGGGL